jgi:hypothetical protein
MGAFVGVVAGFWHILWIAGVGLLVTGIAGVAVQSAGYTRLERDQEPTPQEGEEPSDTESRPFQCSADSVVHGRERGFLVTDGRRLTHQLCEAEPFRNGRESMTGLRVAGSTTWCLDLETLSIAFE